MKPSKTPITNCHTHVFTGDHVPPFLAKSFLWWPFYYLFPVSAVVSLLRWWYDGPARIVHKAWYLKSARSIYAIRMFMARRWLLSALRFIAGMFLTLQVFYLCFDTLMRIMPLDKNGLAGKVDRAGNWLRERSILLTDLHWLSDVAFVLLILLFFKPGRNIIMFALRQLWKVFGAVFGKESRNLAQRYIQIGRYARYKEQSGIFSKLSGQYPTDTRFVLLPMDMEYMAAGSLRSGYTLEYQMEELAGLKKRYPDKVYPFVFADPRRMAKSTAYFDCDASEGKVVLKDCLIKRWLEDENFSGIKIYPALGYYPFDVHLLLLWKYAADRQVPIITHCIRGTIFYRGIKDKAWDEHEVFEEFVRSNGTDGDDDADNDGSDGYRAVGPLFLPEESGIHFSTNFTHPLNYLCLLEEELLRKVIGRFKRKAEAGKATDADKILSAKLNRAFGYSDDEKPLRHNLSSLKVCFGHFGGEDEWRKFLERDRDNYSSQLFRKAERGIEFLFDPERKVRKPGKIAYCWKHVDWYSIICSLMLQYDNVYSDVSYILHDKETYPLLKQTLANCKLREKVLYGSDFYVVRNHTSDKEMVSDLMAGLTEEEFDCIARTNPEKFLKTTVPVKRPEETGTLIITP